MSIMIGMTMACASMTALPAHAAGKPKPKPEPAQVDRVVARTAFDEAFLDGEQPDDALARTEAAERLLAWVAASHDNGALPYIVIDKDAGAMWLFDAKGKAMGAAPVLTGVAPGDEATPGVGSKKLSEIGPAEKTTPAGRFLAKFGWAAGHKKVLWVDYATSVALHAVVTGNKRERRLERLESPTAEDNRITFGCINVPTAFYDKTVRPLFEKSGGVVYVLPDTRPLDDVFPLLRTLPYL